MHGQCQFYHRWFITHWKFRDCIYAALPLGNSCVHSSFVLFLSYCTTIALQHGSSNVSDLTFGDSGSLVFLFLCESPVHFENIRLVFQVMLDFENGVFQVSKQHIQYIPQVTWNYYDLKYVKNICSQKIYKLIQTKLSQFVYFLREVILLFNFWMECWECLYIFWGNKRKYFLYISGLYNEFNF